mgnify:CR=1 FL=1
MTRYTIQVSDHPAAETSPLTSEASESWTTIHDGPMRSPKTAANTLALTHRYVRVFRGGSVGHLYYTVHSETHYFLGSGQVAREAVQP